MPCASPAGPMTDLFGREVALVPVSQRPGKAAGLMTLVTSGLIGRDSSASAVLQRSLESRLMTQLDTAGSTLFKLTWRGRRTPLGRRYLERAVSVRRTSAKGFTSWPTPTQGDHKSDGPKALGRIQTNPLSCDIRLRNVATLTGWATPIANDSEKRGYVRGNLGLAGMAQITGWPTPTGEDSPCVGPRNGKIDNLSAAAKATWATPKSRDWKDTAGMAVTATNPDGSERDRTDRVAAQALLTSLTASGETRIGYSARDGIVTIGSGAQLNPEHSRWLMGLPRIFSKCAERIMKRSHLRPKLKTVCSNSKDMVTP